MKISLVADSDTDRELSTIRKKIIDKTYELRENVNKNCKGKHWKTFRNVFDEEGEIVKNVYACCTANCFYVIKSNLATDGTGKLRRHYMGCNRADRIGIEPYFDKEFLPPAKRIKRDHKLAVNNAAVSFVVNDMRPVDAVTKPGLVSLLATFTQIGAAYGQMNTEDILNLLPSRHSVSLLQTVLVMHANDLASDNIHVLSYS